MKILFEEHTYRTETVRSILGDFLLPEIELTKATQRLKYVGYFFNKDISNHDGTTGDLVFVLPKVLLDADGKVFGMAPEQVMHFNYADWKGNEPAVDGGSLSKRQIYNFIYGFTTWIYRAVSIYRKNQCFKSQEEHDGTEVMTSLRIGQSSKKNDATFMDILLALIDFERTHRGFITHAIKTAHSGYDRTSWPRTIASTPAALQDESPLYLNPANKKKLVDFDEELLIIYYSILDYIHEEYGFPIPNKPGYNLIKGAMFRSYIKSRGKTRLHKIRYKYYSDNAVLLWDLCYAFFDKTDNIKAHTSRKDFLLVNKFETVFEAMVDELIGDKNLPAGLKVGGDDKRIDHLYTYKYLIENMDDYHGLVAANEIYNIADSKYYRRDKGLRGHDVPKQFTYARNVVQWHMDLLHELLAQDIDKGGRFKAIRLFDPLTEGYNIIPNFFISAQVDSELNYDRDNFQQSSLHDGRQVHESYIFWERLFDRSSYFTLHYDVNFLFVLKLFAQNKNHNKATWRKAIRDMFRKNTLKYLNEEFRFWQIMVHEEAMEDFVNRHYRKIVGKVFAFEDRQGHHVLLYAERRNQDGGRDKSYTHDAENDSHIEHDRLIVPDRNHAAIYEARPISLGRDLYKDASMPQPEYAIIGYYKDQSHLDWIRMHGIYNMRAVSRGKRNLLSDARLHATHLVLHNEILGRHIFKIVVGSLAKIKRENLPMGEYSPSNAPEYYVYEIEEAEHTDDPLGILVNSKRFQNKLKEKKPVAILMDKLKEMSHVIPPAEFSLKIEEEYVFNNLVAEDKVT